MPQQGLLQVALLRRQAQAEKVEVVGIFQHLCKGCLHKWLVRPGLGEGAQVLQIARREPLLIGERPVQIARQLVDHNGYPLCIGVCT